MIRRFAIMLVFLMLAGCAMKEAAKCAPPNIQIGSSCCLDNNKNSICDNLEKHRNDSDSKNKQLKAEATISREKAAAWLSLKELQVGINKTFYPLQSSNFSDIERVNITGIQNTFNLTGAGRFYISQIKKDYNYLETMDNFTDFVNKLYKLESKNWEIDANQLIDARGLTDRAWLGVTHVYDGKLKQSSILDKPAYYIKHLTMFDREGLLADYYWEFRLIVYCTPEFIVEIYTSDTFFVPIYLDSQVSTNKDRFDEALDNEKPEMEDAGKRIMKLCQGSIDPVSLKPNEIIFFGDGGFYPQEVKINAGGKVRIYNYNDVYLGAVFIFVREKPSRIVFNSKGVPPKNSTEVEIKEAGEYALFYPEYPARAKVIVTE